jgi:hypothetical protein
MGLNQHRTVRRTGSVLVRKPFFTDWAGLHRSPSSTKHWNLAYFREKAIAAMIAPLRLTAGEATPAQAAARFRRQPVIPFLQIPSASIPGAAFLHSGYSFPAIAAMYHNLEQNPSNRALGERDEGGFFLRKKPLEGIASGNSNSDFAIACPFCGAGEAF